MPYAITGDYKFRSKNLKIVFGEPIEVKGVFIKAANEILYNKVYELLTQGEDNNGEKENTSDSSRDIEN